MRENQRKEEAKYVYMTTIALILLIGFCLRLFFSLFYSPITDVVAWSIGGILLLISSTISYQWHKLKGNI